MAYKNKADRPKQTNAPVGSKTFKARMERQEARRKVDREGVDNNNNGKADKREGKDVSHNVALSKGGSNKDVRKQLPQKLGVKLRTTQFQNAVENSTKT